MSSELKTMTLEEALNAAMGSELYLVAVWRIEAGHVHLYRETQNFPADDFQTALTLLQRDLSQAVEPPLDQDPAQPNS